MGLPVAIIGSGNIGTDLMYKLERSDLLDLVAVIGIDAKSDGLARAAARGYQAPHTGIDWISENPDAGSPRRASPVPVRRGLPPSRRRSVRRRRARRSADPVPRRVGPLRQPPQQASGALPGYPWTKR